MKKVILSIMLVGLGLAAVAQQSALLSDYRTMALKYNHDLKAAEKNVVISMELEKSALANRKPSLEAGANFKYTGNPMELDLELPTAGRTLSFKGREMSYGAAATLMQPVYTGGRILETIRQARHQESLAAGQAETIRSAICYQTDIQYWNTVARQEIVGIASEFYTSMLSLVKTIRERVEAGLVDPQDLLMAEVKLNEAEYQLLQVKNEFETGRMAFNSLLGIDLQNPTEIEKNVPEVVVLDSLLWLNGDQRPELRMAQDEILIAGSALKLNDSQYKPQLYVGVDGSYSSPGYNFRTDPDPNYVAYAKLSIPVFEWGKRRSERRAFAERIGMATDQLNQVKDEVVLEIGTAKLNLLQAQERVVLTGNSLGKAGENEKKALERYNEGKISILEVIDAQVYRQTSQVNYVEAKIAAQSYYSGLIKALNVYDCF